MDRKMDLTIAALIFLAGTAGLVSGEDIGDVETTNDKDGESIETAPEVDRHLRGDANDDGSVDIGDFIVMTQYIMGYGREPASMAQADINGDRSVDVADLVLLADYLWGEDESDSGPQAIDSRDFRESKSEKAELVTCFEPSRVLRGDANDDGTVDLGDFIVIVQYILGYGDAPASMQGADINGDHAVNVLDLVVLADHLWGGQCERC
ncbi:MAG: dockerin type I repeat-containing protein, partial [Candidatus Thermoplasmatota archaeon]|nr:dockerin type I repeat-containing protein [Candidatus Thermoplasmatota archaeon]